MQNSTVNLMGKSPTLNTSANVNVDVCGMFKDAEISRAAMREFTDKITGESDCQWRFRDGGESAWSVRFIGIDDMIKFTFFVRETLKNLGVTDGLKVNIRTV